MIQTFGISLLFPYTNVLYWLRINIIQTFGKTLLLPFTNVLSNVTKIKLIKTFLNTSLKYDMDV